MAPTQARSRAYDFSFNDDLDRDLFITEAEFAIKAAKPADRPKIETWNASCTVWTGNSIVAGIAHRIAGRYNGVKMSNRPGGQHAVAASSGELSGVLKSMGFKKSSDDAGDPIWSKGQVQIWIANGGWNGGKWNGKQGEGKDAASLKTFLGTIGMSNRPGGQGNISMSMQSDIGDLVEAKGFRLKKGKGGYPDSWQAPNGWMVSFSRSEWQIVKSSGSLMSRGTDVESFKTAAAKFLPQYFAAAAASNVAASHSGDPSAPQMMSLDITLPSEQHARRFAAAAMLHHGGKIECNNNRVKYSYAPEHGTGVMSLAAKAHKWTPEGSVSAGAAKNAQVEMMKHTLGSVINASEIDAAADDVASGEQKPLAAAQNLLRDTKFARDANTLTKLANAFEAVRKAAGQGLSNRTPVSAAKKITKPMGKNAPKLTSYKIKKTGEGSELVVQFYTADGTHYEPADYFTEDKADAKASGDDTIKRNAAKLSAAGGYDMTKIKALVKKISGKDIAPTPSWDVALKKAWARGLTHEEAAQLLVGGQGASNTRLAAARKLRAKVIAASNTAVSGGSSTDEADLTIAKKDLAKVVSAVQSGTSINEVPLHWLISACAAIDNDAAAGWTWGKQTRQRIVKHVKDYLKSKGVKQD